MLHIGKQLVGHIGNSCSTVSFDIKDPLFVVFKDQLSAPGF